MLFFGFKSSQVTINTLKVINSFLLVFFTKRLFNKNKRFIYNMKNIKFKN